MTVGREGPFQTSGTASAKAYVFWQWQEVQHGGSLGTLRIWNREARNEPWRNWLFFLYTNLLS